MSDLDFDLNAPAAPSLTLDAAPAAPTLTLDPEADAKVVEEAKKATPVTVEDTPLSPEEQKMVQDFSAVASKPFNSPISWVMSSPVSPISLVRTRESALSEKSLSFFWLAAPYCKIRKASWAFSRKSPTSWKP